MESLNDGLKTNKYYFCLEQKSFIPVSLLMVRMTKNLSVPEPWLPHYVIFVRGVSLGENCSHCAHNELHVKRPREGTMLLVPEDCDMIMWAMDQSIPIKILRDDLVSIDVIWTLNESYGHRK